MESILDKFFKDKNIKSLVIDGPWGCGKTYLVNEYIKSYKGKSKINYISLFGYDDIDEINSRLYYINNKNEKLYKKFHIIPRFIDIVTLHKFSISESIENTLRIEKEKYKVEDQIIIFDDFERTLGFDYEKIMGYFNSLIGQGCRIICIISSSNMMNEDRESFDKFKEKVFDAIYKIDEMDLSILETIFRDLQISSIGDKLLLLDCNIRLAKKIRNLFKNILDHLKLTKVAIRQEDNDIIFVMSFYAVIVVFGTANIKKFMVTEEDKRDKNNKGYTNVWIDNAMRKYDVNIRKNIKDILSIQVARNDLRMLGVVESVCAAIDVLIYDDYGKIDNFFEKEDEGSYKVLKKELYYLSDDEKKQYCIEFVNYLNESDFIWDSDAVKRFAAIFAYTDFNFSDELVDKIAGKIINNQSGSNLSYARSIELLNQYLWTLCGKSADYEGIKAVSERISTACENLLRDHITKEFNAAVANTDYIKLEALIQAKADAPQYLLELFKNNGFCLPDLTETITYAEWRFCHSIAAYVSATSYKDLFIRELVKIVETHKNSYSLKDRVFTLANVASENAFNSIDDLLSYKSVK